MIQNLLLRILLVAPWVFIVWLVARGFSGEIDGLLVFVLLVLLMPLIIFINVLTIVLFKGRQFIKKVQQAQKGEEPLKSDNYAELPWWNPKKWQ